MTPLTPHRNYRASIDGPDRLPEDANIRPHHPAERAAWIWAKEACDGFRLLQFDLELPWSGGDLTVHVTADQRFQFFVDGVPVGYGPDRGAPDHWKVSTLNLPLDPGVRKLSARVWYHPESNAMRFDPGAAGGDDHVPNPPMAQMTVKPGFLVAADREDLRDHVDTGRAAWRTADLSRAVSLHRTAKLGYHDIGPGFDLDMALWRQPDPVEWAVVQPPVSPNVHGVVMPGWKLEASDLPEQRRESFDGGCIRALRTLSPDSPWSEPGGLDLRPWNALLHEHQAHTVPVHTALELIWDLDAYQCGYPLLEWDRGTGALITLEWAESLYETPEGAPPSAYSPKGNRRAIEGKTWLGFGDSFRASGAAEASPGLWWRSGRYLRLSVETAAEPLILKRLAILTTGYPFARGYTWSSSDPEWDQLLPLLARGLELGAHETWVDCPYYEQLNYVGDTRLHILSNVLLYPDDRLSRQSLINFAHSREGSGLVAERYPSQWRQESGTYALLYPCMVKEHWLWRGDQAFTRRLLPDVRALMEQALTWREADGWLGAVPGWPCVDWVRDHGWKECCGPGMREGDSSIINLHFVHAALALASLEQDVGEDLNARRWHQHAGMCMQATLDRYWDAKAKCLLDTRGKPWCSEHAQALAILTGLLTPEQRAGCRAALTDGRDLARCTISFSHTLFEAYRILREEPLLHQRMAWWKTLPGQGFHSLPEAPEPTRSDCHGWGAHPLFHTHATVAGIRPAVPGMKKVVMAPMPGPLAQFEGSTWHPEGQIRYRFDRQEEEVCISLQLPPGIDGEIHYHDQIIPLGEGGGIGSIGEKPHA